MDISNKFLSCYWFAQSTPRVTLTATLRARRRWAGVRVIVKVHPSFQGGKPAIFCIDFEVRWSPALLLSSLDCDKRSCWNTQLVTSMTSNPKMKRKTNQLLVIARSSKLRS